MKLKLICSLVIASLTTFAANAEAGVPSGLVAVNDVNASNKGAETGALSGVVVDETGEPVAFASVVLVKEGRIVAGAVTDEKGRFQIKAAAGKYTLTVEFIGYEKYSASVELSAGRTDVGSVVLKQMANVLGGSVVSARQEARRASVERTTITADAYLAGGKGSVSDIIRGASALRGKANVLVLIDGVPTMVTDLESIPAANVKSIDIITNPDAKYDSEGTGGIINIVMKKPTAAGVSGIIGMNYGFSHFANGQFALTSNSPRISWRVSGNAKYEDDLIEGTLSRSFVATGSGIDQQIHSAKTTANANVGGGVTIRPNKKNTITADVRLLLPRYNTKQDFHNLYTSADGVRSENRFSDVTWNRENIDASASWRHVMVPEHSEFTLGANVSKIWGHRPSFYYLHDEMVSKSDSGGSPFITSAQGDAKFKYALGTLECGAKITFRSNDQYSEFYSSNGSEWMLSPEFSADLDHHEYVPAAYVLFSSKEDKKFSYKLGLRTEYSIVTLHSKKESLDKKKGDLFVAPSLSGTYRIGAGQTLSLAYGRRIGRPTYPQLNPYMCMVDANTFEQGNLDLDAEKTDNIDLSYSMKKGAFSLFSDIYLNHTKDYITQVSTLADGDKLLSTYVGCARDMKAGLDLSLKVAPTRWLDATLSTNTYHSVTRGELVGMDIDNQGWSNSSNLLVNVSARRGTDLQLQYVLMTPQYYPQFTTALNHYMNVGMKQSLCKGALVLSITATDVFGTDKWEIHSSNSVFTLANTSLRKSRMLWLGVSYNFNSFKQQKTQKKQEVDRSRLNLGL